MSDFDAAHARFTEAYERRDRDAAEGALADMRRLAAALETELLGGNIARASRRCRHHHRRGSS